MEEGAATARLRRAGAACSAALRATLDALGAEGALDASEQAARLMAETGIEAGPAARGAIVAK
eukprot:1796009-Pleurochrysis_carterae.AAC.1